jgi:outer membrane protein TolC
MMKKVLPLILFAGLLCGNALAVESLPQPREEITVDSLRKERMASSATQDQSGLSRATIDVAAGKLPKAAKQDNAQAASAQEKPKKAIKPATAKTVNKAEKPRSKPSIKINLPWGFKPKKEEAPEEQLDKKIQGTRYRGETGFTTINTYAGKTFGVSAGGAAQKTAEFGLPKLNLDDCLNIAEANNIQLMVARKSIKLAELRLFEARRNMLPSATIVAETSKGMVNDQAYLGRKQYVEGQQPVFHGGELYFTMKQAEVNLEISKNDYERVKNEMALQIKKAYYTLEKAKANNIMQHDLSSEVANLYNISSKGHESGAIANVEFFNVSSQVSQVKYQFVSADGDEKTAALILKQAMNINPRENFDITPSPEFKKVTADFEQILQDAFVTRPEIKANALMITYYNYGRGISAAKGMIKVDLLGQWGLAWEDYTWDAWQDRSGAPMTDPSISPRRKLQPQWYAGIKASMPVWGSTAEYSYTREQWVPVVQTLKGTSATTNSFKFKILDKLDTFSDRQLADIDYDRSRQELNKTKNDVTLEIQEGCFNYEKALIQLDTATNKVKYQTTDTELVMMKRSLDEVQDSNVIDSLIKLAQEKFGYVQAVTDCKISLASLEKAVGRQNYFKDK